MGVRASRWWCVGTLVGACQPFSGGVGTTGANTLGPADDTGDITTSGGVEEAGTASTHAADTSTSTTTSDASGPPEATTTGPGVDDTTTDDPPPMTTGEGEPLLSISDGATFDFGSVPTGGQASHLFTVTNSGDGEATGLQGTVAAPFSLPGGFPGGAGTCGQSLAPGADCLVEVVFSPNELGLYVGTLAVGHAGGPDVARDLAGGGAGQSANLLANPGGESFGEPPPSWTQVVGNWIAGVLPGEAAPFAGAGYIYADTGANNTDYSLQQTVAVSTWAVTIDQGLLNLAFSSRARALVAGNDQHRIRVHYLDQMGSTLALYNTDYQSVAAWTQYADTRIAPIGTRSVRVELNCRKMNGDFCNAYFDALDLRAEYP
jgi:hypothetical protein